MPEPEFRGVHAEFLADETSEIDFEGARFSGKTWACLAKVIISCLKNPGIRWLCCRYSNEETKTKIKPVLEDLAKLYGVQLEWHDSEKAFHFPTIGDLTSKIFCHGLKSIKQEEELAKVRGLEMGGILNDQAEETPQSIADELPFGVRQPGYPHQLIFAPNPPDENHFLCDRFPEDCVPSNPQNPFPHRRYYRVALRDNIQNLPPGKIKELEDAFPPSHAKHRALILGLRGPSETGIAVYDKVFEPALHCLPVGPDYSSYFLESFDVGRNHPVWTVSQRTPRGGIVVLGGVMGKRMFQEDFLPIVDYYRSEWFDDKGRFKVCSDPPPSANPDERYTHLDILREAGLRPIWRENANAPDVRESVIQSTASLMRRRAGDTQAFVINTDPDRWLMVSSVVTKRTKLLSEGCESSYVWSPDYVSVGNKKVRQPKFNEWVDGWQRCIENTVLNFSASVHSDVDRQRRIREGQARARQSGRSMPQIGNKAPWMI